MPWGTDCMFQKYSMLGIDPNSPRSVRTVGLIAHRLYQIPSVRQTYARHMKALMNQIWDETSLLEETYRIEKMVRPHLHAQQRRTADFEAIRTFIRERREDVEKEIMAESMPLWNAMPEPPPVIGGRRPDTKEDTEELPAHAVFFEAAKTGNIPSMKKLLKQGQDVNYQDEGEEAPWAWLHWLASVKALSFYSRKALTPTWRAMMGAPQCTVPHSWDIWRWCKSSSPLADLLSIKTIDKRLR